MSFWNAVGLAGYKEQQDLLAALQENQESINQITEQVLVALQKQAAMQIALTQGFLEMQTAITNLDQDIDSHRKFYEQRLEEQKQLLADTLSGNNVINTSLGEIKSEMSDNKNFVDSLFKDLKCSADDNNQIVNAALKELKDVSVSNNDNIVAALNAVQDNLIAKQKLANTSLGEIKSEMSDNKNFVDSLFKDLKCSAGDNNQIVNAALKELKDVSVSNNDNLLNTLKALQDNIVSKRLNVKKSYDELQNSIQVRCEELGRAIAEVNLNMSGNDDVMLAGLSELEQKSTLIVKQQKKNYTEILNKLQALFDLNNNVKTSLNAGLSDNQQQILQLFELLKCVWLNDLSKDLELALGNIKNK